MLTLAMESDWIRSARVHTQKDKKATALSTEHSQKTENESPSHRGYLQSLPGCDLLLHLQVNLGLHDFELMYCECICRILMIFVQLDHGRFCLLSLPMGIY